MNVARTDISNLVLITLEAEVPALALKPFTEKLKRIIEVYTVTTYTSVEGLKKTGFYWLSVKALNNDLWSLTTKYGATLSNVSKSSLVISKTGMDKDLAELCSLLEGPHLLGFRKSELIMEDNLVLFEQL